jgi:DNA-binding SARP family transcriptional activator
MFLCTIIIILFIEDNSKGQTYGLAFSSHEVFQDRRTGLDLTPKPLALNPDFDISFDLTFVPNCKVYFGYIVRIIEDDKRNIDLVYTVQKGTKHFNLIAGDKLTDINFNIDSLGLFKQWNTINIQFDYKNDKIRLNYGNSSISQSGFHLKKGSSYKILFGVNDYKQFQTTDTPPMKVRNINIKQNGLLKYNWPLNEDSGPVAHETINQQDGVIDNPAWVAAKHYNWQFVKSSTVQGMASVTFDKKNNIVYLIGADSLYSFQVSNSQWSARTYKEGRVTLNLGNRAVFNPHTQRLYSLFTDQKFLNGYDSLTRRWNKKFVHAPVTDLWHFNKFFSLRDNSLYILAGYGHLRYKNNVQQYNFSNQSWEYVNAKGDFFTPRYLAALGANSTGDTAYILGGYGNSSGQQILNPKNIYDMMRFSVADRSFKKLFELKPKGEDFAFANSLIIDGHEKGYYGLIFQQHRYNSRLRLIKGSLKSSEYELMGNTIPYRFHDEHSFADLFYSPVLDKFIAVTLFRTDEGQTKVSIYTLLGPPLQISNVAANASSNKYWPFYGVLIALLVIVLFYIGYRLKKGHKADESLVFDDQNKHMHVTDPVDNSSGQYREVAFSNHQQIPNTIQLFGDFHVIDATGTEITKLFTPLVKELFLIIFLHSVRWDRGLSPEKLNEILWYDKSAKSARNNCSVNITKLKVLLDRLGHYHLSNETGYWKIDINYQFIQVDYYNYLKLIKDKKLISIQEVKALFNITERGNFLSNLDYEWLDPFKAQISNEIVDIYLHFAHSTPELESEFLIELCDCVFYFDPVNEDAMILKCKALHKLGKHSLAKSTFENFTREYKILYDEIFKKDFHAILE